MKNFSIMTILALLVAITSFAVAGETEGNLKYVEFSQMGNPAEVLEVKYHSAQALKAVK